MVVQMGQEKRYDRRDAEFALCQPPRDPVSGIDDVMRAVHQEEIRRLSPVGLRERTALRAECDHARAGFHGWLACPLAICELAGSTAAPTAKPANPPRRCIA